MLQWGDLLYAQAESGSIYCAPTQHSCICKAAPPGKCSEQELNFQEREPFSYGLPHVWLRNRLPWLLHASSWLLQLTRHPPLSIDYGEWTETCVSKLRVSKKRVGLLLESWQRASREGEMPKKGREKEAPGPRPQKKTATLAEAMPQVWLPDQVTTAT